MLEQKKEEERQRKEKYKDMVDKKAKITNHKFDELRRLGLGA